MGFRAAVASGFRNYASFSGRTSRAGYWWWWLFLVIAALAARIVLPIVASSARGTGALVLPLAALVAVGALALVVPTLAIQVRRLHDSNHSGWWVLVQVAPWLVAWAAARVHVDPPIMLGLGLAQLAGSLVLIGFMLLEPSSGDNRYGPFSS